MHLAFNPNLGSQLPPSLAAELKRLLILLSGPMAVCMALSGCQHLFHML